MQFSRTRFLSFYFMIAQGASAVSVWKNIAWLCQRNLA